MLFPFFFTEYSILNRRRLEISNAPSGQCRESHLFSAMV
jgi:hypothetical protein